MTQAESHPAGGTDVERAVRLTWRQWVPDVASGAAVGLLGSIEVLLDSSDDPAPAAVRLLMVWALALAVGFARRRPGTALVSVWVAAAIQADQRVELLITELSVVLVAFGTGRWGSRRTVWLSGLSIPVGGTCALYFFSHHSYLVAGTLGQQRLALAASAFGAAGRVVLVAGAISVIVVLAAPWLLGLATRATAAARASKASQLAAEARAVQSARDYEQMRRQSQLREQQAQLARDVHDVVGHSLTVILAQAEAAQYAEEGDVAGLKRTMVTIATSARTSLREIRHVLSPTAGEPTGVQPDAFDRLVEGVRLTGREVVVSDVGRAQALPPELEVVALRVMQEMLTNAMKHSDRGSRVGIEREWTDQLHLTVDNVVGASATDDAGLGLEGMRRRLAAVGGDLHVLRRPDPTGDCFTVSARLPLRAAR